MGHQAADWLERPERDEEERPDLLLAALHLKPGNSVADIGAGTGFYTRRMAKLVGDHGLIYAVEIQQEMLDLLTNKMTELNIRNVKPVLGTITDPKLPRASIDLVLMVDVYHEFDYPHEMVEAMCLALKPGGRIVFVEFRGEDPKVPIKPLHKMTDAQVRKEMSAHPLQWMETSEILPRQHIIIFKKTPKPR
jgi:ubiquinone/menaquinone biosynthesis C-methylase UbiE